MRGSVLSVGCRALLLACERLGLDGDALAREAGLDRARIDDPDARLSPLDAMALWERAEQKSGDPHLALAVARSIPPGAYRVLEYLCASAPTVGAAFEKLSAYFAWIDTTTRLPIVRSGECIGIALEAPVPAERVPLRALEFTFATSWLKVRELTGRSFHPERVELSMAPNASAEALGEFLGCPLRFSAAHNCMLFSGDTWELASSNADASLLSLLEQHARHLLVSVQEPDSVARGVERLLRDRGPSRSLPEVAKALGLSERTLQRRLAEEGVVFADLAASVREDLARRLLTDRTVAIAEIAYLLGFSDQSSFTRWFKRRTAQTPAAFRAAHRSGPTAAERH